MQAKTAIQRLTEIAGRADCRILLERSADAEHGMDWSCALVKGNERSIADVYNVYKVCGADTAEEAAAWLVQEIEDCGVRWMVSPKRKRSSS